MLKIKGVDRINKHGYYMEDSGVSLCCECITHLNYTLRGNGINAGAYPGVLWGP